MELPEFVDQTVLDNDHIALLGWVNYSWAQLDLISSGAFASLLKLDPVELGITIGRIETQAKIAKMLSIAKHRHDKRTAIILQTLKAEMSRLRPTRNAVTHGAYIGKSGKGELIFRLPAEFLIDDKEATGQELFIFTAADLQKHIMAITKVALNLRAEFDLPEMRKLLDLPGRVRTPTAAKPNPDKSPKTRSTPRRPSPQ